VLNTFAKRFSVRANLDIKATERLSFGTRTALSYSQDNRVATDEFFQSQLAYPGTPLSPVLDADSNFTSRPKNVISLVHDGGGNTVANLLENERRSDRYRILSNVYAELEIVKGLGFKSLFGVDFLVNELRNRTTLWVRG
jgi:hypothetical protein